MKLSLFNLRIKLIKFCFKMSNKEINIIIDIAISEIRKPDIEYHFFRKYSDFMENRHLIPYFKFDHKLLNNMLRLIEYMFGNDGRCNRSEMLNSLNCYIKEHKSKLDEIQRERIFNIVRPFFENGKLPKNARIPAWKILQDLPLFAEAEAWLCKMTTDYSPSNERDYIDFINRVLRYPIKSDIIHQWISDNFENDVLRLRRAEAIGWLLYKNPNYVIDDKTLIDDFDFANRKDMHTIKTTVKEEMQLFIDNEIEKQRISLDNSKKQSGKKKLCYRLYAFVMYEGYGREPNFNKLRQHFYNSLDKIKQQTMSWAVYYSHLNENNKVKLLKKFYHPEIFETTFSIAKNIKSTDLLTWLKTQRHAENYYYFIDI